MPSGWVPLSGGGIASAAGFLAGAAFAGLKTYGEGKLDLGLLFSEAPCRVAGTFTTNKIKAAPVLFCQEQLGRRAPLRALIANSGNANCCTGAGGMKAAREMAALAAQKLGIPSDQVLVASTGLIGRPLNIQKVRSGVERITLSREGGHDLARAIMTTDTRPKEVAYRFQVTGRQVTVGGIAKGAGMIHPNMATMLSFLTTDAAVEPSFLQKALKDAVDASFNMITVDGDMSTNDTVLLFANGLAGNAPLDEGAHDAADFREAVQQACVQLARAIVYDGEGASRYMEVGVEGAVSLADARIAARTIARALSVKTALHGKDPNWGRVMAALGQSQAEVDESRVDLYLGSVCVFRQGQVQPFDHGEAVQAVSVRDVSIRVCLNLGGARATAWGCDLTKDYVAFNSEYTT